MESSGPLSNVTVVELANERTQFCGKLLADMGADVIVVEPPEGSSLRHYGPFYDDVPDVNRSLPFWYYNTNKRSATLDLTTSDGLLLFESLCSRADVLLHAVSPGDAQELSLDIAGIASRYPTLVVTAVTSFGLSGPRQDWQATDLVHLALGGQMSVCGYDDVPDSPPMAGAGGQAWHVGGVWAAIATAMALVFRFRTGEGQIVDAAVHDACADCTELAFSYFEGGGQIAERKTGGHAHPPGHKSPPSQLLCADGKYVNVSLRNVGPDKWADLVSWLDSYGMADDLTDDKYYIPEVLDASWDHVVDVIIAFAATRPSYELMMRAQEMGHSWCKVNAPDELLEDPHLRDRDFFVEVEHEDIGTRFEYAGAPYLLSDSPWQIRRRAPLLGEHNRDVYVGELGLSSDELSALTESRVV